MIKLKDIIKDGGATLDKNGNAVTYATGFQVSKQDLYKIPVTKLKKYALKYELSKLADGECLGIWIENGIAYIDISERIANNFKALKIGRERKQISVYGWNKGLTVYC